MKPKSVQKVEEKLAEIGAIIEELPARERKTFKRHLGQLSQTNCWWVLYRSRSLLYDLAENVPRPKAKKAREASTNDPI